MDATNPRTSISLKLYTYCQRMYRFIRRIPVANIEPSEACGTNRGYYWGYLDYRSQAGSVPKLLTIQYTYSGDKSFLQSVRICLPASRWQSLFGAMKYAWSDATVWTIRRSFLLWPPVAYYRVFERARCTNILILICTWFFWKFQSQNITQGTLCSDQS